MQPITIQAYYKGFFAIKAMIAFALLSSFAFTETYLDKQERECDNNDSYACNFIGNRYLFGDKNYAIEIDMQRAMKYFIKACNMDHIHCTKVAQIYEIGENGFPKNLTKAVEYYKRYCDSKYEDLESCQKVGQAYATGDGVPKDFKIASEYYKKACKHDQYGGVCTRAKILNAVAEVNGDGITVAVLTKSCDEKKNWFSCSVLAGMYWNGKAFYDDFIPSETAPKDLYKAHEYFAKGCAINKDREISVSCSYAKKTLDEIKAQETNASIKAK